MVILDRPSMVVEMPVTLRIAEQHDIPQLEWYGQYTHYRNLFRRAYREQLQGKRLLLIADCNNFPIGHVFIQFRSANLRIADGHNRAYLYSFRVMEIFRGQGIGTRLVEEAETLLVDRGFRWATIAVVKENLGALQLYERLGYKKFGDDSGRWSYRDHLGEIRYVHEPCWVLEKNLRLR